MIEEQHDELDFLTSFRDNARQQTKVKSDFKAFIDAPLITMKGLANVLVNENPQTLVVSEMKKIDLKKANNLEFARIQFLINELSQERVVEYRNYIAEHNSVEDATSEIEKLTEQAKEIRKDNKNAQLPNELIDEYNSLKEYVGRIEAMLETILSVLDEGITGDLSLDDTNMAGVFFKFKNIKEEYIPLFIKEIRRIRSDSTKAIKKVTTTTSIDNDNNELSTVLFFFDTEEEAMTFYAAKAMLEGVYDKYLRVSEGAKATGSFDIIQHKFAEYINANLPHDNPLSGMYVDPNAPIPVSPTHIKEEEEDIDFYEKYEEDGAFDNYKASDFVFIVEYIGEGENNALYITPKEFWRINGHIYDQHINIDHILPSGFDQVQESCFVYDGSFDDAKEILINLGMKEVSQNQEDGDDTTVYPEDSLFGIITTEDTLSFRFVSRERYINQLNVYEGEPFFDEIDNADDWCVVDDNQWEYKDGNPAYLKEAIEYLLGIGMTHEQELDNIKDIDDTTVQKINELVGEKVAIANQIEEDLKVFVATQYEKVLSWKRNPSDFSVYWNGIEWKMILSSEVEVEPVRNTLDKLYNEFNKLT